MNDLVLNSALAYRNCFGRIDRTNPSKKATKLYVRRFQESPNRTFSGPPIRKKRSKINTARKVRTILETDISRTVCILPTAFIFARCFGIGSRKIVSSEDFFETPKLQFCYCFERVGLTDPSKTLTKW